METKAFSMNVAPFVNFSRGLLILSIINLKTSRLSLILLSAQSIMRLPDNPQSSKPAPCGCRSTGRSLDLSRRRVSAAGFSLIELLVVVAIISIMAGLLTLALQGVRAPAVRGAASQVTSGLSLARQVAITKNTKAALFIANDTANGRIPYRHWSVGYSNKSSGNWTLSKKWEPLPEGAFFLETLINSGYSPISTAPILKSQGETFTPANFACTASSISIDGKTFTALPYIMFSSDGAAISGNATTALTNAAIRIASGLANTNSEVTITSLKQYFFVETDGIVGRIRMRAPEDYK